MVLPLPLLVIERVNFLGQHGPSIWTFANRHGQNIGDTPQEAVLLGNEDVESVVEYPTKTPGVPGVDPDFDVEPTGVEMDSKAQGYVPEEHNEVEPTVKCPVAQHKLHRPIRAWQHATLELGSCQRSMSLA